MRDFPLRSTGDSVLLLNTLLLMHPSTANVSVPQVSVWKKQQVRLFPSWKKSCASFLTLTLCCHISTHIDCFPLVLSVSLPPWQTLLTCNSLQYILFSFFLPLTSELHTLSCRVSRAPCFRYSLLSVAFPFNSYNPNGAMKGCFWLVIY